MTTFSYQDLNAKYEKYTCSLRCDCVFATEMVGGQPADEAGVRAYVIHHLKLEDPEEQEAAVKRILHEEVEDVTPSEGELPEGKLYGLRAVRKIDHWPYAGDWMVKAAIKQASSRLGIFEQFRGSKGDFSEAAKVLGWKQSFKPEHPNFVFLCAPEGGPAHTYYKEFMGRVSTRQGPVSIIHQSECVAPGTQFSFEFRFLPNDDLTPDTIGDMLGLLMTVGLGSARSLECGKFRIENAELDLVKEYHAVKPDKKKKPEPVKIVPKVPEELVGV